MNDITTESPQSRLRRALWAGDASTRLQAALTAGTNPDQAYIDVLVERCSEEPDFFVRDMLTWALTRHDRDLTVDRLLPELASASPLARSQALHTLSKIRDPRTWPAITDDLLMDEDAEVARAAWRTAAGVVPTGEEENLARKLATQFGRGEPETQRSLSRAFAVLDEAVESIVVAETHNVDPLISAHAMATLAIMADPDTGFEAAIAEAKRVVALQSAPAVAD
ncbi:HEAT repeat domain-containing protein [Microbacterium gorillae]|uniref:HEAT repeat domain-containing protein n=1 Tax=Microbacterium gorillae TaxID=1231063 RepID=UPI003D96DBE8